MHVQCILLQCELTAWMGLGSVPILSQYDTRKFKDIMLY